MRKIPKMNVQLIVLIVSSILLSSTAQIILKLGMSSASVIMAIQSQSTFSIIQSIVTNIYVIGGLTLYFASAAVWLFVLAKVDVSFAYPFVGLGFIVTMLLAYLINGEMLSATKVIGTLCIAIGIVIVAQG